MGFRFRQGIRIFPGLRLNLSKSGVSVSAGRPGATLNLSKKGIRSTIGIPGSGVSYSDTIYRSDHSAKTDPREKTSQASGESDHRSLDLRSGNDDAEIELYRICIDLVIKSGKASASWLSRQLRVNYNLAANLIERMEDDGIVSEPDRIGRRTVLLDQADFPGFSADDPNTES